MEFLRTCARRLDEGEDAEAVLRDMAVRYTTPRCMNVKTSLVRSLCAPASAYTDGMEALCDLHPTLAPALRGDKSGVDEDVAARVRELTASLPSRVPDNVRALRVPRAQMKECKRLGARAVLQKNRRRLPVRGSDLLAHARGIVAAPDGRSVAVLALALMLLTGRRTCEVLNGASCFVPTGEHSMHFGGLAKQRGGSCKASTLAIPVLAPAAMLARCVATLRDKQHGVVLPNKETSRRYQSLLGRTLASDPVFRQCSRPHALRGIYACMALRLFEWDLSRTDAYLAMCILGHSNLDESLAYTAYHLVAFEEEASLGEGVYTADGGESHEAGVTA